MSVGGIVVVSWNLNRFFAVMKGRREACFCGGVRAPRVRHGHIPTDHRVMMAIIPLAFLLGGQEAAGLDWKRLPGLETDHAPQLLWKAQASYGEFEISDVVGQPGEQIPIRITFADANEDAAGKLFIFSGVPAEVTLSPGGNFGQFWAVNSLVFDQLTLTAADGFEGSFEVRVIQTGTSPGDSDRSATFTVTIAQPDEPEQTETVAAIEAPQSGDTGVAQQTLQPRQEPAEPNLQDIKLMERATTLLSMGDISGARTVFKYLAARGNAQAAIALGGTYDPAILSELFIKGLDPDPEQARLWYEKAGELGSPEASSRLAALNGG